MVEDLVSLTDFAPTTLDLAGLPVAEDTTASSFVPILTSDQHGLVDPQRSFLVPAREWHAFVR